MIDTIDRCWPHSRWR